MKSSINNRYASFVLLTFLYFVPLAFFASYSLLQLPVTKSWGIVSLGFLLISVSSLIFFLFLLYGEKTFRNNFKTTDIFSHKQEKENKIASLDEVLSNEEKQNKQKTDKDLFVSSETIQEIKNLRLQLVENQENIFALTEQLTIKENEKQACIEENKRLENKFYKVSQDFSEYKLFGEEQLKQKNLQLTSAQMMIEDQRTEMEKRQEQICHLDSKIHDLSYEIRTLIHLHEVDSTPVSSPFLKVDKIPRHLVPQATQVQTCIPEICTEEWSVDCVQNNNQIQTAAEAWVLLRKCIGIAQKLTGASYYGNESSRFREFSSSHFTIDQRRLFDNLRNEENGLVLVYSQKENKLLFANHQTKNLLGCSPEKFITEFASFFQDSLNEWKKALSTLNHTPETQARLLIKTKKGSEIILNSHFGIVPTGLFRNYVICVLYPN